VLDSGQRKLREQEFGKTEKCKVWFYRVSGLILTVVVNWNI